MKRSARSAQSQRTLSPSDTRRILAVVASETRTYTDPAAGYQIAAVARTATAQGAARRAA